MSYTKTQWNNDTAPAINATNLNKIEQGIYDNDSAISTNTTNIGDLTTLTTTANTDLVSAINELDDLKATKDVATTALNGLMSSIDKGSLNSIFGVPTDTVTDLNQVYEGAYKFNTNTTNAPTTTSGKVLSFKLTTDNYRFQIVMSDYTLDTYTRYRYYVNSQWQWSGWYRSYSAVTDDFFKAKKIVRSLYYQNHANTKATITFPLQGYHVFYVTLYTRHSGIKNIRVEETSSGDSISISGDTTINYGTITTSGRQLIISTQSWESITIEITSLNADTDASKDVNVSVGAP